MGFDRPPTRPPRDPLADDIVDALEERLREQRRKNARIVLPILAVGVPVVAALLAFT